MAPTTLNPSGSSEAIDAITMETMTTASATGLPGRNRSPSSSTTMTAAPNASTVMLVCGSWVARISTRSKKNSPPPLTPNSFGSWVRAMVRAAPALKPNRMVSLMKLTSELSLNSHARKHITAISTAVSAQMEAQRAGSPAAIPATVTPTSIEMADVGPIASWRDVPNTA
ncbi:hypothetical protein D3C87_1163150 [compost metagenome]